MKVIVEYLGTGPNPIEVPKLKTEKPIEKGDRVETTDEIAYELVAQGLFAIVADVAEVPEPAAFSARAKDTPKQE